MTTVQNAQAVNDAILDPVPEIHKAESPIITLQRGIVDPATGTWYSDAEVREMTGADEEYMAGIEAKSNFTYSDYMSTLLKRVTIRIGSMSIADNPSIIDNLSIGDRDILFLGLIRATYGSSKEFQASCASCNKDNDVVMNLDEDFPIQEPSVNLRDPIKVKIKDGRVIKLRVPTGGDSAAVGKKVQSSSAQNTLMIARCAVWDEGDAPADPESWAKSLNIADRNKLVKALLSVTAGPKLEAVNVPCAHCGEEMTIAIDWISLLLS